MEPAPSADNETLASSLDMTLRQWIERYQNRVVFDRVHYRGVLSWKNVLDLWVIQEIIWETKVEAIIEIGVRHGGTTLWLSDVIRNFTGDLGRVVSIDLEKPPVSFPPNVKFIVGDSIAAETCGFAAEACAGRRTMVIADGNHAADHVLEEMRRYGPLVSTGCYFLAEDGIVDVMQWEQFTPGPMAAAHRFIAENDSFVIDRSREKFLLTYTPDGFLKRVK